MVFVLVVGRRSVLGNRKPGEGLPVEAWLKLQISARDFLFARVSRQPGAAVRQQLFELVVADEVVLVVVEDRNQDIEMREQLARVAR